MLLWTLNTLHIKHVSYPALTIKALAAYICHIYFAEMNIFNVYLTWTKAHVHELWLQRSLEEKTINIVGVDFKLNHNLSEAICFSGTTHIFQHWNCMGTWIVKPWKVFVPLLLKLTLDMLSFCNPIMESWNPCIFWKIRTDNLLTIYIFFSSVIGFWKQKCLRLVN